MTEQNRSAVDWEDVRVFLALARHGSLSAAARVLGVTHATVSRRVASLEAMLGEKVVERRRDGYALTPAGIRVLGSANDMETAAAALRRGGTDDKPKGLVRINTPPSLAQGFLVPRLAKLALQHAGLDLDVSSEFRNVSLERREADIVLRLGRPQTGDVIAKPLVTMRYGFYATVKWLRRIKQDARPEFVSYDEVNSYIPEAAWLTDHFPHSRIAFRTNNQLAQASAATEHVGIALLPHFVGRMYSDLRLCTLKHEPPARELWLITRQQDRKDLTIRTVIDHLAMLFASERDLFDKSPAERSTRNSLIPE